MQIPNNTILANYADELRLINENVYFSFFVTLSSKWNLILLFTAFLSEHPENKHKKHLESEVIR